MKKIDRIVFSIVMAGVILFSGSIGNECKVVSAAENISGTVNQSQVQEMTYKLSKSSDVQYFKKTSIGKPLHFNFLYKNKSVSASKLSFSSTKSTVAEVSPDGTVTPKSNGVTVIKVKYKNGIKSRITVTVADESIRTLFVGDSRSVALFSANKMHVYGLTRNNTVIYAMGGANVSHMKAILNRVDLNDFDHIVSWMGVNDQGRFGEYKKYYDYLLRRGKKLTLCTVGPTNEDYLEEGDDVYFSNELVNKYNKALKAYASKRGLNIIDVHGYLTKKKTRYNPSDGVHYLPRPNKKLWQYIVKNIK